jgi:hypothetical protein
MKDDARAQLLDATNRSEKEGNKLANEVIFQFNVL